MKSHGQFVLKLLVVYSTSLLFTLPMHWQGSQSQTGSLFASLLFGLMEFVSPV